MNADCINEGHGGKLRPMTPTTAMIAMGNNEKTVRVSDPTTRKLLAVIGLFGTGLVSWFALQVQKNAVETSVLTKRVDLMENQFPAQIRELKTDIKGDLSEVKEMIRRLDKK